MLLTNQNSKWGKWFQNESLKHSMCEKRFAWIETELGSFGSIIAARQWDMIPTNQHSY